MKFLFSIIAFISFLEIDAQRLPDQVYMDDIKTPKLYYQNDQLALPILKLGSGDQMELHFDEMGNDIRNYFYTFELCNTDWEPANLSPFDYIKGFTQNRISQYRQSSLAQTPYIHYAATLPTRDCVPTKSGNYLLKVFLNGDTSQLAFTKRFYVVDNKASIGAQILQPFDNTLFNTHQKLQFSVNAVQLNPVNPQQQVKVVVMQNHRWDNAVQNIQPAFIRSNILEYDGERDCVFPAGKEYRWADLRSYRFESDRIESINKEVVPNMVLMRPDADRTRLRYSYYGDLNGAYEINTTESINPWWQTNYAYVHFIYVPENNQPYSNKNVYLLGEFTGNNSNDSSIMQYNADRGIYEKTLFLKQGYYSYTYVAKDIKERNAKSDVSQTDGNSWETENEYTVFVYFRSLSGRHDELVGVASINSRAARTR